MDEEMNEEPLTIEEYKKLGEAVKNVKKYMHIFIKLIDEANIDSNEMSNDELHEANSGLINLSWEIGRRMEEDYPNELELAHDLFF